MNINIDEERLAYAIELAKRVTDKCVANRILTASEGNMVFDSLVDGFQLKSTEELAQALIDMEER